MNPQSIDFVENSLAKGSMLFRKHRNMFYYAFDMPYFKKDRPNGVYLLGDFYVGKSIDYASRILGHRGKIISAINGEKTTGNTSSDGALRWFERFGKRSIPVFHMSNNHSDEYIIAKKLIDKGFPLANNIQACDGYYNFHMTDKEVSCLQYLTELGYEIEIPESRRHLIIPKK